MDVTQKANELIYKANKFYGQKKYDQAITAYQEAIALVPDSPVYAAYKFVIGEMLMKLNRHQEAIRIYEEVVEKTPAHDQAWSDLGKCFMMTGNDQRAVHAFERCLEIAPVSGLANYYLALVHAKKGKTEKAKVHFQRAIEIDPGYKKWAQKEPLLKDILSAKKAWWKFGR